MGLSRNKVAVSEGAAGSPPFYGEPLIPEGSTETEVKQVLDKPKRMVLLIEKPKKRDEYSSALLLFNF